MAEPPPLLGRCQSCFRGWGGGGIANGCRHLIARRGFELLHHRARVGHLLQVVVLFIGERGLLAGSPDVLQDPVQLVEGLRLVEHDGTAGGFDDRRGDPAIDVVGVLDLFAHIRRDRGETAGNLAEFGSVSPHPHIPTSRLPWCCLPDWQLGTGPPNTIFITDKSVRARLIGAPVLESAEAG